MAMRVGFVPDNEENIMQFVDRLKLSIKRKINVENMWSLNKAYHLALRIEGQLKRNIHTKQQDEKENEILLNVVAVSVDCTSEVHVVEEVDEVSEDEMHVVNSMLRESFAIEYCGRDIVVNGFGKQT